MVLNQENVKIIIMMTKKNKQKNIVVLILLSEIKKLKTVSLPVHIAQKKKKTSACLVLNKKRTWPVMRKSAGCLSRVFITTFSKIGNKISQVLKSHIPWPILALSAKGPTSMNTAIWRWLRFIHFVLQVSIHDCYLK